MRFQVNSPFGFLADPVLGKARKLEWRHQTGSKGDNMQHVRTGTLYLVTWRLAREKKKKNTAENMEKRHVSNRDRTSDLSNFSATLSQLSY